MKLRSQVLKMYINIFKVSDVPSSTTLKLGVLVAGGGGSWLSCFYFVVLHP